LFDQRVEMAAKPKDAPNLTGRINRLPAILRRAIDRDDPRASRSRDANSPASPGIPWLALAATISGFSRARSNTAARGASLTMAGRNANTLVQIGSEPNVLADRPASSRRCP